MNKFLDVIVLAFGCPNGARYCTLIARNVISMAYLDYELNMIIFWTAEYLSSVRMTWIESKADGFATHQPYSCQFEFQLKLIEWRRRKVDQKTKSRETRKSSHNNIAMTMSTRRWNCMTNFKWNATHIQFQWSHEKECVVLFVGRREFSQFCECFYFFGDSLIYDLRGQ